MLGVDKICTEDCSLESMGFLISNATRMEELAENESHGLEIESFENFMIALSASTGKSDLNHDLKAAEAFSRVFVKWDQSLG